MKEEKIRSAGVMPVAIEEHHIDFIPEGERHGRPRDLF